MKNMIMRGVMILVIAMLLLCNIFASDSCLVDEEYESIYLIGEEHDNEECIRLSNQLKERAKDREIILCLEGRLLNDQESNALDIFGIEEKNIFFMNWALIYYMHFIAHKIMHEIMFYDDGSVIEVSEIINDFKNSDHIGYVLGKGALKNMISILLDIGVGNWVIANNKEIIKAILEVNESFISGELNFRKIDQFMKTHSFETPFFLNICSDISQWISLFRDATNFYLDVVVKNKEISSDIADQVIGYMTQFEEYAEMDVDAKRSVFFTIWKHYLKLKEFDLSESRNYVFLESIVSIFEKTKSHKKSFYVITGSAHAPFLYEKLRERGYNIVLNDRGQDEYDKKISDDLRDGKRLIGRESAEAYDLVKRTIERSSHQQLEVQKKALGRLGILVDNKLIDQNILDEHDLVRRVIEKIDLSPVNVLFILGILVEYELIDRDTINIHKLKEIAMERLSHKQFGVKVNSLWILSLLLEKGGLFTIESAAKSVEDCHRYLIVKNITLSKRSVERIKPVFGQFLGHPDEKIRDAAAEIIQRLEKNVSVDDK